MSKLKYIIPIIAGLMVSGLIWAANVFPTSLNVWEYNDVIEEDWGNALENTIGITNSSVITSHDYLIRDRLTISTASSTFPTFAFASSTYLQIASTTPYKITSLPASDYLTWANATSTYLQIGSASSTYLQISFASSTYSLQRDATTTMNYHFGTKSISDLSDVGAITETSGQILYTNASGQWVALASSTDGLVLTLDANGYPSWAAGAAGDITAVGTCVSGACDNFTLTNLGITYGLTAGTSTWSGRITANGGFVSSASSTIGNVNFTGATISGQDITFGFTYTTSTWSGTTTLDIPAFEYAETWNTARCNTNVGNVAFRIVDESGNATNYLLATSSTGFVVAQTLSTNNAFTAGESAYVQMGSPETAPTSLTCRFKIRR